MSVKTSELITDDESSTVSEGPSTIVCAKCREENPSTNRVCQECGSHLHIACRNCGQRNVRSVKYCVECGQRMHKPSWHRWKKRLFSKTPKITLFEMALLVVMVAIAYKVIIRLANM